MGRKWVAKLDDMGIQTAQSLEDADPKLILKRFGVVMARTQKELQGKPCIALEEAEPDRKQIIVSRSFGQRVEDSRLIEDYIDFF